MGIEAGVNRDGVLGKTTCLLEHLNGLKGVLVENSFGFALGGEMGVVRGKVDKGPGGGDGGVLHIGGGVLRKKLISGKAGG